MKPQDSLIENLINDPNYIIFRVGKIWSKRAKKFIGRFHENAHIRGENKVDLIYAKVQEIERMMKKIKSNGHVAYDGSGESSSDDGINDESPELASAIDGLGL